MSGLTIVGSLMLSITTSLSVDEHVVQAEIVGPSTFPTFIFMFENTGSSLGDYYGVCTLGEYERMSKFVGTSIPIFGNKFLRSNTAIIRIPLDRAVQPIIDKLILDVKSFKAAFLSSATTNIIVPI